MAGYSRGRNKVAHVRDLIFDQEAARRQLDGRELDETILANAVLNGTQLASRVLGITGNLHHSPRGALTRRAEGIRQTVDRLDTNGELGNSAVRYAIQESLRTHPDPGRPSQFDE